MKRTRGILVAVGVAAVLLAGAEQIRAAFGSDRSLTFYNIHTKETVTVLFKKDGRYVPEGLEQFNWAFRDWRKNEATKMDPALADLLWEIHTELGSEKPIHIISGYRARETNDMLRRSVGGQASQSRHILGKAADVHFPDVSLKQLRYSALVRERGGVGYYPTSAIPFVHIDTDRVRHWPRLPRYELALLFPDGNTKHQPASGGPITREDVQVAQARHGDVATQVAAFFDVRAQNRNGATQVAEARRQPAPVPRPEARQVAALSPDLGRTQPQPRRSTNEADVAARAAARIAGPSAEDRSRLTTLASLASAPQLVTPPKPAIRPEINRASLTATGQPAPRAPGLLPHAPGTGPQLAAVDPRAGLAPPADRLSDVTGWGNGWVSAPAYDEEHPEELSYRPFPVLPYLTTSASADDPVLAAGLRHPDVARTLDLIGQAEDILPLALRPGEATASLMWAQAFKGEAVNMQALQEATEGRMAMVGRKVRTSSR